MVNDCADFLPLFSLGSNLSFSSLLGILELELRKCMSHQPAGSLMGMSTGGFTKIIQGQRKEKGLIPSNLLLVSDSVKPAMVLLPGSGSWFHITVPLPHTHSPNQPHCGPPARDPLLRGLSPSSKKALLRAPTYQKQSPKLLNFYNPNFLPIFSQSQEGRYLLQLLALVIPQCSLSAFSVPRYLVNNSKH